MYGCVVCTTFTAGPVGFSFCGRFPSKSLLYQFVLSLTSFVFWTRLAIEVFFKFPSCTSFPASPSELPAGRLIADNYHLERLKVEASHGSWVPTFRPVCGQSLPSPGNQRSRFGSIDQNRSQGDASTRPVRSSSLWRRTQM